MTKEISNKKEEITCKNCRKKFIDWKCKKLKYCSKECYYSCPKQLKKRVIKMKGENNPTKRPEVREKMRKNHWSKRMENKNKGKKLWGKEGITGKPHPSIGLSRPHTEDEKRKVSLSLIKYYDKHLVNPRKKNVRYICHRIRSCLKYKKWREEVFERDNYTCQKCGENNLKELECHHIKPLSLIVREHNIDRVSRAIKVQKIWDTKNGKILCVSCHNRTKGRITNKDKLEAIKAH